MLKKLLPDLYVESVYLIDYEKLKKSGVDTLIFDIDNTLAAYSILKAEAAVLELFKRLKSMGYKICLASNNREERVKTYAVSLGVPFVHSAFKPSQRGYLKSLAFLNSTADKTAVIGDQIFTDIWGGNRLKMYTILVNPISDKDLFFVKFKRKMERLIIRKIKIANAKLHDEESE